ncbi:hypothetical protein [Bacillus licheniformis]|uniref:hypothetical protein n=1 Tax=Bacillus licheniformis TaxID=1402 RepID=UPI0032156D9E
MKRVSNEELPSSDIKKAILKHRKWIIGVIGIFIIWYIFFGRNSGLTQKQFENKLSDLSDGMIRITDSRIEKTNDGSSVYMAKWNGLTITATVDGKNNIVLPYGVIAPSPNQMNEISLGQFQEVSKALSGVADSKLSKDDRDHLILNDLNFNEVVETGTKHSTSKNGKDYDIIGSNGMFIFMVGDERK